MLLILTNTKDATADYLGRILSSHGVNYLRLDTDSLLDQAEMSFDNGALSLRILDSLYSPESFSNVWYRRPERLKLTSSVDASESDFVRDEWSEALEGFFARIPQGKWVNHPSSNVAASHKIEQLVRAPSFGLRIPKSLVTHDATQLRQFFHSCGGQIITKPLASAYVERQDGFDSVIYTNPVLIDHLQDLSDLSTCPTLFQERIDKSTDVRITIIGHDVHAVALSALDVDGLQRCDIRRNNMIGVEYKIIPLPESIRAQVTALSLSYGLRFAAIDMAITSDNEWVFFEINPNGQWAWLDIAANANMFESFVKMFQ